MRPHSSHVASKNYICRYIFNDFHVICGSVVLTNYRKTATAVHGISAGLRLCRNKAQIRLQMDCGSFLLKRKRLRCFIQFFIAVQQRQTQTIRQHTAIVFNISGSGSLHQGTFQRYILRRTSFFINRRQNDLHPRICPLP